MGLNGWRGTIDEIPTYIYGILAWNMEWRLEAWKPLESTWEDPCRRRLKSFGSLRVNTDGFESNKIIGIRNFLEMTYFRNYKSRKRLDKPWIKTTMLPLWPHQLSILSSMDSIGCLSIMILKSRVSDIQIMTKDQDLYLFPWSVHLLYATHFTVITSF